MTKFRYVVVREVQDVYVVVSLTKGELVDLGETTAGGAVETIARGGTDAAIRTDSGEGRSKQQ